MSFGTEFSTNVLIRNTTINSVEEAKWLIERAVKPIHRFLAWIGCKAQR